MNILGIHIGHDSSAALVRDGKIVADVAEERFTRIKHYSGLPINSIAYCLKSQNLSMADIDAVAIPTAYSVTDLNFLLALEGARKEKTSWKRQGLDVLSDLSSKPSQKPPLYIKNFPIGDKTEIVHVEHHLAHAASAYYTKNS
jgi:carbamoyltransferase